MTAVIGHVEAFQPEVDDWEQYTERLEQYFVANGIESEEKKLAVFLTVMGARTYGLLSDLLAPVKPATKSYADLVQVLKAHLKPKPLIIAERFHFHQRMQEDGETVATYLAALRRLADKCEYGNHLSQALRDRFVCGLRREAIQRKLLTMEGGTHLGNSLRDCIRYGDCRSASWRVAGSEDTCSSERFSEQGGR